MDQQSELTLKSSITRWPCSLILTSQGLPKRDFMAVLKVISVWPSSCLRLTWPDTCCESWSSSISYVSCESHNSVWVTKSYYCRISYYYKDIFVSTVTACIVVIVIRASTRRTICMSLSVFICVVCSRRLYVYYNLFKIYIKVSRIGWGFLLDFS